MITKNYRIEIREWLGKVQFDLAATYTFKKDIDLQTAEKIMQSFYSRIDNDLYGNSVWRYNKRVQRANFAETGVRVQKKALLMQQTDGRLHVHSAIKMPEDRYNDLDQFSNYINDRWINCNKLAGNPKIVKIYNDNWINYITKQISNAGCDTFMATSSFIAETKSF